MGLIADAIERLIPERKQAVASSVPTWQQGTPQYDQLGNAYLRFAREGYGANEIVYSCIEELCTSAAEPKIAAYRKMPGEKDPEKLEDHPLVDLFERPNPFMSRYDFVAGIILHLQVAGNAYVEKVRSRATGVAELWLLRPDRVRVIPHATMHVGGYLYELGDFKTVVDARDIIHIKLRNPMDDFYGLPPLAVVAKRTDTDNWMKEFTRSFFVNAGVPAGLLNVQKAVTSAERELIRTRFRSQVGAGNWHSLLVLDNTEATYTPMGLPLGERGIVLPDLDEISEARIASVFGVPLELIGARLGMIHGNRSTTKEARATFWDETLTPLYEMVACDLSAGLVPEFGGLDYIGFDLSTVKALAEDEDAKHTRIREDMNRGVITREEARTALGYDPEVDKKHTWVLSTNVVPEPVTPPEPLSLPEGRPNGNGFGGVPDEEMEVVANGRASERRDGRSA